VRATQSFTASQMYHCSQLFTSPTSMHADGAGSRWQAGISCRRARSERLFGLSGLPKVISSRSAADRGERLLHNAQNLPRALGHHCDLLSLLDLLKPERREYVVSAPGVGTQIESPVAAMSSMETIESRLDEASLLDRCAEFSASPQDAREENAHQPRDG
jgi:hypothetical protein